MTDYSDIFRILADAFAQLPKGTLRKDPLKVPTISSDSDDQEKRDALKKMLKSLSDYSPGVALSKDEIRQASAFFVDLYSGEKKYRHRYADICNLVFSESNIDSDELDEDGVPYSVTFLAENINLIYTNMIDTGYEEQAKSVLKLADHIDLEKTRLLHYRHLGTALAEIRSEKDKAEEDRKRLETQTKLEREKIEKKSLERLDKIRMDYISILGIFSAAVLAFNGAAGFSNASIRALGTANGLRALIFIVSLVGFTLINAISALLIFVWKMSFKNQEIDIGKWPKRCLITANGVLIILMILMGALSHPAISHFFGLQ